MKQAKQGDTVRIHYTGTLDDGTQFDSSSGREPIEFILGEKKVIPGFESGVEGMQVGEQKRIHIPAEEAYGEHNDALVEQVPLEHFPDDLELRIGMNLQASSPNGEQFNVVVTALDEKNATIDGNHPLAGEALNFDLELVEIV
ncbi:MAG: peptidylprolyl isomerase [gamma proteobacterium symbiont of Ctena orbiculata]|nr:peptidylprolyl isomerase [Candidatus Thiodiazotropha taylori]MBT3060937.1 peptidylprolyl isomerase [Candidatus Thiodiazotropha sp. (ex Lucina pensylvanica)]MBT3064995.1 peptidylprolyl isomerase [Candidatus Thiodiazotropha sp. (ex Lucina pensylvanica)]MBV2095200.1 peptidylprolyl isomerase [Candidatus Thiodiazotropha sp. (ex Codakia orbicularis)]PUB78945.1 MAG: peptidylprolyl isomerase [gamma proteobacterium symbiont of Ctena orbiculata]